jgi:hypothetical protein
MKKLLERNDGARGSLSPYEKRREATAQRLREAIYRLIHNEPYHPDLKGRPYRLTVANLAREAGIGRSAIYANHRAILDDLAEANAHRERMPVPEGQLDVQRSTIDELKAKIVQLTSENAGLLKRTLTAESRLLQLDRRVVQLLKELETARRSRSNTDATPCQEDTDICPASKSALAATTSTKEDS